MRTLRNISIFVLVSTVVLACQSETISTSSLGTGPLGTAATAPSTASTPAPTSSAAPEPISIVLAQPVDGYAFMSVYAALTQGFFEQDGIDAQLQVMGAGGQEVNAILSGEADIAISSGVPLATSAGRGAPVVGVMTIFDHGEIGLAFRTDVAEELGVSSDMPPAEIFSLLEGLRIGMTAPATLTDIMANYYVQQGGLDPVTDVEIIAVGPGAQGLAALENDAIDAFVPFPPFTQLIAAQEVGVVVYEPYNTNDPDPTTSEWLEEVAVVTTEYASTNAEVLRRVLAALTKGNQWINENSSETVASMLSELEWASAIPSEITIEAVTALKGGVPADPTVQPVGLQNVVDVLVSTGFLDEPIEVNEYIDNSFLP